MLIYESLKSQAPLASTSALYDANNPLEQLDHSLHPSSLSVLFKYSTSCVKLIAPLEVSPPASYHG